MKDTIMAKEAIVLLMFSSPVALQEYTVRDGLSECLKAKRTIERNVRVTSFNRIQSTMRLACKLNVEVDEDNRIIEISRWKPSGV